MSLVWFLTAHVLEYTSVNTCRHSSPHLWWLTFGILCTLYLMILEIFILGLLVFILGPVLYVCGILTTGGYTYVLPDISSIAYMEPLPPLYWTTPITKPPFHQARDRKALKDDS